MVTQTPTEFVGSQISIGGTVVDADPVTTIVDRWAEYVRTHDDEAWSRQQNRLIDPQLQSANELALNSETDAIAFAAARDRRRRNADGQ